MRVAGLGWKPNDYDNFRCLICCFTRGSSMSVKRVRASVLLCALLGMMAWTAAAQSSNAGAQSAELPSAPVPAKTAAPVLTLPAGSLRPVMASHGDAPPAPVEADFCYAPMEGIYSPQPKLPPKVQEALERYIFTQSHSLDLKFNSHLPRSANNPWIKGATTIVRFAILPDGSIDTPIVTSSSGRRDFDKHALDAVRAAAPFAPLPAGANRPAPVCMHFRYNVDPAYKDPYPAELWPTTRQPGL